MSKTITVNNELLELITNGGGCSVCHLKNVGVENFEFGKIAECVRLTNNLCTKNMGSYFKLKK